MPNSENKLHEVVCDCLSYRYDSCIRGCCWGSNFWPSLISLYFRLFFWHTWGFVPLKIKTQILPKKIFWWSFKRKAPNDLTFKPRKIRRRRQIELPWQQNWLKKISKYPVPYDTSSSSYELYGMSHFKSLYNDDEKLYFVTSWVFKNTRSRLSFMSIGPKLLAVEV